MESCLKQAAMMAKSQGRLPGEMERLVSDLLDPQASWREILRNLLTSTANDDYTWSRPNRRFSSMARSHSATPVPPPAAASFPPSIRPALAA